MGRKEYRTYHLRKCTLHYLETRRYLNISESETSKKKKECHCAKETKYWVKAYCIHYFLFFFWFEMFSNFHCNFFFIHWVI